MNTQTNSTTKTKKRAYRRTGKFSKKAKASIGLSLEGIYRITEAAQLLSDMQASERTIVLNLFN